MGGSRFEPFLLAEGESDLWIGLSPGCDAPRAFDIGRERLRAARAELEAWIKAHPEFQRSLEPLPIDADAPSLVRTMLEAARLAEVGPMAAVAGAIAEAVGRAIDEVLGPTEIAVENGGDIWLRVASPLTVAIYAGIASLSGKIGLEILPSHGALGVCTSSGTVGPSLSFGKADACLVACADAALADAYASAFGNRIKSFDDLDPAIRDAGNAKGIIGAAIVRGDRVAATGNLRLVPIRTIP
jgi:ApbE superfamily uncharacterized protein (UPF0280 family)